MSAPETSFTVLGEPDDRVIEVDVFKCCTVDGKYLGDVMIHNPDVPGDGPWYLMVKENETVLSDTGFGTKDEALAALDTLERRPGYRYEVDVDPWD